MSGQQQNGDDKTLATIARGAFSQPVGQQRRATDVPPNPKPDTYFLPSGSFDGMNLGGFSFMALNAL